MSFPGQSAKTRSVCAVSESWNGTVVTVACVGVLDILTAVDVERRIVNVLGKQPKTMIVDLSGIDFLASHGMNMLVAVNRLCGEAIQFAVVADGPVTRRPMQLIGITDVLAIYPTEAEAIAGCDRRNI